MEYVARHESAISNDCLVFWLVHGDRKTVIFWLRDVFIYRTFKQKQKSDRFKVFWKVTFAKKIIFHTKRPLTRLLSGDLWVPFLKKPKSTASYHIKSLQCAQKVGCLKNFGANWWFLTATQFFSRIAPFRLNNLREIFVLSLLAKLVLLLILTSSFILSFYVIDKSKSFLYLTWKNHFKYFP